MHYRLSDHVYYEVRSKGYHLLNLSLGTSRKILLQQFKVYFFEIVIETLVDFFRNANPDKTYKYYYSDFSGTDPSAPFPLYRFNYNTLVSCW